MPLTGGNCFGISPGCSQHAGCRSLERRENVWLNLITVGNCVRTVEQADDGHHFAQCFCTEPKLLQRGGVGIDAIGTTVCRRHGKGNDLRVVASSLGCRPTASGCISALSLDQTRSRWSGFVASTRHRFGTKAMFFVRLMSAKISAALPVASPSATGATVAILSAAMTDPFFERPGPHSRRFYKPLSAIGECCHQRRKWKNIGGSGRRRVDWAGPLAAAHLVKSRNSRATKLATLAASFRACVRSDASRISNGSV